MSTRNLIAKIVSGGQTGADQGALDAALEIGIPCGGWCPKGRKSEAGPIPDRYPLREASRASYLFRTEQNVIDSHATLLFTYGKPKGGSKRTIDFAEEHQRPWLHIDLGESDDEEIMHEIHAWILGGGLIMEGVPVVPPRPVLNVAGSRESKNPGIQERVRKILLLAFNSRRYPLGGE